MSQRYVVHGPVRWKRSLHSSLPAALHAAHACSAAFPNAICKIEQGLPGMQRVTHECNRRECWTVGAGLGRGRHKKSKRSRSRSRSRKGR